VAQGDPAANPDVAQLQELIQNANALQAKGAYAEAALLWQQILGIVEKALGPENTGTATGLNNLAFLYARLGRFAEAESLFKRSLAIIEKVQGPEHPNTATSINNLGSLYQAQGRYGEAEPLYKRSLAIREKVLGPEHPDTATSLNNLADLHQAQGRYVESETLHKRSLAIREKALGPQHPDTAGSLNNLADLYRLRGRYGEAEPLYKRTLAIREKVQGPEHPDTATSLNNLAVLYGDQGRYGESEPLYRRSLGIREKVLRQGHPDTAISLNNLAVVYVSQGRYGEAEILVKRSLAIIEEVLGPEHLSTATSINNLAVLYVDQGRYGEAETLHKRSLGIFEKALGPEHPDTATNLNNLAFLYRLQGRLGEAEPLYKRALAIREKALGPVHPDSATSLSNLALLHLAQTNVRAAESLLQRLTIAQADWLRRELPLQPRVLRASLIDKQPNASVVTFALLDQHPAAAALALETRLNRQGLLAEIERRQALIGRSPETRLLAEQLAGLDRQLASHTLPPAQREPLRQRRQQLENQLYRLFPSLRIEGVSTAQVAAALRNAAPQGLLVEFQKYRPYANGPNGKGEWGPARYVALLLRPDGSIRSIPLGAAEPIDAAIAKAVAASADSTLQADAPRLLAAVSQLLLKPLQAELAGMRELFVSPDGELNRLPFAALPMAAASGLTLGESVQLRLLTTGRELVRLQQFGTGGTATTLIINPDFGPASTTAKTRQATPATLQGLGPWQPLPGTAAEAEGLAPLLRPHTAISGRQATAALVLQQQRPRILHIATHGFFLPEQPATTAPGSPAGDQQRRQALARWSISPEAPSLSFESLQRSGLVFAGANQSAPNPADDAYLTAAEATAMNLEGTELVTLSACDTARGSVRSGEGVYGLQRALAVAGARSTLLSLWKVDDDLTALFMEEFYKRLKAGEGRAEALRHTQAWFRTNPSTTLQDVRVWGAFQLSGDWRPMAGW
jgi:tetratricopeptide (TPR) repeat protein